MKSLFKRILMVMLTVTAIPVMAQMPDYGTEIPLTWNADPGYRGLWDVEWSPDGKWILIWGRYSADADVAELFLIPSQGGVPQRLTADIPYTSAYPRFTADSREVVFSHYSNTADTLIIPVVEAQNIYTGERRTLVKNAFTGMLSQDGKMVVYETIRLGDTPSQLICQNLETGAKTVLVTDQFRQRAPFGPSCFDPTGAYIITSLPDGGDWFGPTKLFSIPVAGGTPVRVTGDILGDEGSPKFSPRGDHLLYTKFFPNEARTDYTSHAYILDLATGVSTPLISDPESDIDSACWSPDGEKVCYILWTKTGSILYVKDITGITGGHEVGVATEKPAGFALSGNYPNPFNPTTTIGFTLPSSGVASLAVYSITGQKVRDLVNGPLSAGAHSVVWDGRDNSGKVLSSGVYLPRLTLGNRTVTGKMLLAK